MIDDRVLDSILFMSKLELSRGEREEFKEQVDEIISYFEVLRDIDTSSVKSRLNRGVEVDDLRSDERKEMFSVVTLKSFAVNFLDGYFSVPRILEEHGSEKDQPNNGEKTGISGEAD